MAERMNPVDNSPAIHPLEYSSSRFLSICKDLAHTLSLQEFPVDSQYREVSDFALTALGPADRFAFACAQGNFSDIREDFWMDRQNVNS